MCLEFYPVLATRYSGQEYNYCLETTVLTTVLYSVYSSGAIQYGTRGLAGALRKLGGFSNAINMEPAPSKASKAPGGDTGDQGDEVTVTAAVMPKPKKVYARLAKHSPYIGFFHHGPRYVRECMYVVCSSSCACSGAFELPI